MIRLLLEAVGIRERTMLKFGWITSGCLLGVALFLAPVEFSGNRAFLAALFDGLHLPGFALFTLAFYHLFRLFPKSRGRALWGAVASATALALAVEGLQSLTGRTPSWMDMRNGLIGIGLTAGAILSHGQWPAIRWWTVHAVAFGTGLALVFWPAWKEWRGLQWRATAFPVLGEFRHPVELKVWRPQGEAGVELALIPTEDDPQPGLLVKTSPGHWSGVSYSAGDADWSGFQNLTFKIFNPGEPFLLGIRVDDHGDVSRLGHRYQEGVMLQQGIDRFNIPLDEIRRGPAEREFDLAAVRRLAFFTAADETAPRAFYLGEVRLE